MMRQGVSTLIVLLASAGSVFAQARPLEVKDGVFARDGKHVFLMGSVAGGGNWNPKTLWLSRLHGFDFVEFEGPISVTGYDGDNLKWQSPTWAAMLSKEMVRQGIHPLWNLGIGSATTLRRMKGFPRRWSGYSDPSFGTNYPFDVSSGEAPAFYRNRWMPYLDALGPSADQAIGAYLFSDFAYASTSPEALSGFRDFVKSKYGSLKELNRVCKTTFASFQAIPPPHDLTFLKEGSLAHRVKDQQLRYPELFADWVEFLRGYFAAELSALLAKLGNLPARVGLQSRFAWRLPYDKFTPSMDVERLSDVLDFLGLRVDPYLYDFRGRPADAVEVLTYSRRFTLYPHYMQSLCPKPLVVTIDDSYGNYFPWEERIQNSLDNQIVGLDGTWARKRDPDDRGVRERWFKVDHDDRGWPKIQVPDYMDRREPSHIGVTWYRRAFKVDARHALQQGQQQKYTFWAGKADDERADVYLNGRLVHTGARWSSTHRFDITKELKYGETNTMAIRLENAEGPGGIYHYITISTMKGLSELFPMRPNFLAAIFWQYALRGFAAVNYLLSYEPRVMPALPHIKAELASVAPIVMPRPRRRGSVAMLYPVETNLGLVAYSFIDEQNVEFMNIYSGSLFSHVPFDLVTCRQILDGKLDDYDFLIVPFARLVRAGTLQKVKEFIRRGGGVLVTRDSFQREDATYEPIDLKAAIDFSQRRVHYLDDRGKSFAQIHAELGRVFAKEGVARDAAWAFEKSEEFPWVETQVVGSADAFVVYILNWGGQPKKGRLKLTPRFLGAGVNAYRMRYLRGEGSESTLTVEQLAEGIQLDVRIQDPIVLVFDRADRPAVPFRQPSPDRSAALRAVASLQEKQRPSTDGARLLMLTSADPQHYDRGRRDSPVLVRLLEAAGAWVEERTVPQIQRAQDLKDYDAVIILEDHPGTWKWVRANQWAVFDAVRQFVRQGGGLFVTATASASGQAKANALNKILNGIGVKTPGFGATPDGFEDPGRCISCDARQVAFFTIMPHAVTQGVHWLYTINPTALLNEKKTLSPLILSGRDDKHHPEAPVLLAGAFDNGRVVASGDTSFMQPIWIGWGDNLQLTWNIMRWITKDKIPAVPLEELQERILFTESDLQQFEREDAGTRDR